MKRSVPTCLIMRSLGEGIFIHLWAYPLSRNNTNLRAYGMATAERFPIKCMNTKKLVFSWFPPSPGYGKCHCTIKNIIITILTAFIRLQLTVYS